MNWRPTTEKPEEGRKVWILHRHWRWAFPGSYYISSGEVEHGPNGVWRVVDAEYGNYPTEDFEAWIYVEDFDLQLPDWLTKDNAH